MSIRCGTSTSNVNRVYCGTTQINRAYCGNDLVFGTVPSTSGVTLTSLTTSGSSISARQGMGMVGSATSGLIFGGHSGSAALNDFYSYSVSGGTVTITALTSSGASISGRHEMGMTGTATSGAIFGGRDARNAPLNDFYSYSVASGTVTLTLLTKKGTGSSIGDRSDMGMAGLGHGGAIFGGRSTVLLGDFYRWVALGSAVTITSLTKAGTGSNISARWAVGMVGTFSRGAIFGGAGSRGNSGHFYSYSISGRTGTITALTQSGSSISARHDMGMAGDDTGGAIFGGYDGTNRLNDFYSYSISGAAVTLANLTKSGTGSGISARTNMGFAGTATSGIIFGGYDGTNRLNDFYSYTVP